LDVIIVEVETNVVETLVGPLISGVGVVDFATSGLLIGIPLLTIPGPTIADVLASAAVETV